MGLHPLLEEATRPGGEPRFFPHGQHPAIGPYVRQLARFIANGGGESPEADFLREQIAAFEERESLAKAVYLQKKRGHV